MLDEISIKKQINVVGGKFRGYVNLGTEIEEDNMEYATGISFNGNSLCKQSLETTKWLFLLWGN